MDLVLGLRLFVRGAVTVLRTPRPLLLGAIPALIVSVLYLAALGTLIAWLPDIAAALTPFADGWSETLRTGARIAAGAAVVAAGAAVAVVTFVAVTLAVGGPFYEKLAEIVDESVGPVPGVVEPSWVRSVGRGVRDGVLLIGLSVLAAIPLFVLGFVPVVGPVLAPVAAALVGGRLLMIELTAPALQRRGLDFGARRRLLRTRRLATWGVGIPTYLLAAIPFVAVLAIPAASAAATLLARELRGEPTDPVRPAPRGTQAGA
ncbi:EI24 domain-containing protein [Actinomycetospora flava]|uniref:EI24 domain-containing protein n=1 Tax=Actinomycetospora flava TaxID=3129232 RepID=A0ABU8M6B4_9PSEU